MKPSRLLFIILSFVLLNVAIEIVSNFAANQIPKWFEPYIWLSWPILGVLALLMIIVSFYRVPKESFQELFTSEGLLLEEKKTRVFEGDLPPGHHHQDWGEAIDVSNFYGRKTELNKLEQWIVKDHCRLVLILGMGGIGKTSIAVKLTKQIQSQFTYLFWRDLKNAPLIEDILADCILFLSDHQKSDLPEEISCRITLLIEYLRKKRCLLVLDNSESILRGSDNAGTYREGYEGYGDLLKRVGEAPHQSCLILTSREKPREIATLEGKTFPVRSFSLPGLKVSDGQKIIKAKGISGTKEEYRRLVERYQGNALALKLAPTRIQEVFHGNITKFLEQDSLSFGDIKDVLEQQFERLSKLEQDIVYWLTINREPTSLEELKEDFTYPVKRTKLHDALESVIRRSQIEKSKDKFTLQPVVMDFLTERLIEKVYKEIISEEIDLFNSHALIKATSKDYIRNSQIRLILKPLADLLQKTFGLEGVKKKLKSILSNLQRKTVRVPGYTGGNIINFLIHLQIDLRMYDFSNLAIWQGYLQEVELKDVNLAYSDITKTLFSKIFDGINCLVFSSNGKILATGHTNGEIRLWRVNDCEQLYCFKAHSDTVTALTFNQNGRIIASSGGNDNIKVWDIKAGICINELHGHNRQIQTIIFNSNGSILASGGVDCEIRLWNINSGQCIKILSGHTGIISEVIFNPNGNIIASCSDDCTIKLWEVDTGRCIKTLKGHTDSISSIIFSKNGDVIISSSADNNVKFWEINTGRCIKTLEGNNKWRRSVAISPNGEILAGHTDDYNISFWSGITGKLLKKLQRQKRLIWRMAFSPDSNTFVTCSDDLNIKFWNIHAGKCTKTIHGHNINISSLVMKPNEKTLISGSDDGFLRVWNLNTGRCTKSWFTNLESVFSVTLAPDGLTLASSGEGGCIKVWNLEKGQLIKSFNGHSNRIRSVTFSSDGCILASASDDNTVKLWDIKTWKCLKNLKGHTMCACRIAFNPQNNIIATSGGDQTIRLWDVKTGYCLKKLQDEKYWIKPIVFNPEGNILAIGGEILKLWDIYSDKYIKIFNKHTCYTSSIVFAPDGETFASGGFDHTIRFWDIRSGQCRQILYGHKSGVLSLFLSPDGSTLASGSFDGTIKIWDVQTGKCVKTLHIDKPYERMNITGVTGITEAQKATLIALGAIENE